MKKLFLFITTIGMLVSEAFGSASLRLPPLAEGAITSKSMITAQSRAGTLRTTQQISSPATNPHITTPVSSFGTYARQPISKNIKSLSTSKLKNTTTQELNKIDSRIEELQSKLDIAEATQTNVVTTDELDKKITEKIKEIGITTPNDTYTKEEVNKIIEDLTEKLPKIDDRGNINIFGSNGVLVPLYWIHLLYTNDLYYQQGRIFKYGTSYVYETNKTVDAIRQFVSSTVCNNETSYWCWIHSINDNGTTKEVTVIRFDHGYGRVENSPSIYWGADTSSLFYDPETNDTTHTLYWSFENSPAQYIRDAVCEGKPETDCFIATGDMRAFYGALNVTIYGHRTQLVEIVERGQHTGNNFNTSLTFQGSQLIDQYTVAAAASVTETEISTFLSDFCDGESDFFCYILNGQINTLPTGTKLFVVIKRAHGFGLLDTTMLEYNGRTWLNKLFFTNEPNPASYIQNIICANKPETDCYVADWWNMIPINNNVQPGLGEQGARYQVSIMDAVVNKSEAPTGTYIPLTAK